MFHHCPNINTIVIQSQAHDDNSTAFEKVTQEVRILVPINYKFNTFCGKKVTKVLPPYQPETLCRTCSFSFNILHSCLYLILFLL